MMTMRAMAQSTNRSYDNMWGQWVRFCRLRDHGRFLVSGDDRGGDRDELLTYMAFNAGIMGNAYSTVKSKLMALRQGHLLAGCGDPLIAKERVRVALRGLRRASSDVARIFPVTVEMLR